MQSWEIRLTDWVRIALGNMPPAFFIEVIFRVVFIYVLVILCIRLMGKRMASQLSRNELVAISSLAASIGIPIQTPDRGLLPALLVALIVVIAQRIVAARVSRNEAFEARTQGNISILVDDCYLNIKGMESVRVGRQEIFARLRAQRIKHLGQVKRLYFESKGDFTIVRNPEKAPGLSVLPIEDEDFRKAQYYSEDSYVCSNCGRPWVNKDDRCKNCGDRRFEHPMLCVLPVLLAASMTLGLSSPAEAQTKGGGIETPQGGMGRGLTAGQKDTLAGQLHVTAADRWYKNCFIYNLDVHTFQDSDGDGIGDFRGLTARLGYLKTLGVDVVWLAPFQPSPHRDDGYDITDFYGIDAACGTAGDFAEFLYQAHRMGIRVIMDMVLDHTSDEHPWFIKAVADTNSPYYHWYYWSHERPANQYMGIAFPGVQKEVWTWQPVAKAYYYHKFYAFQPHLNLINPACLAEAQRILGYWLGQGIDGFRLDAVPFMVEIPHTDTTGSAASLSLIIALRQFVQWRKADALLLGEANVPPAEISNYFGETGDELHMLFNFYGNQYLVYALASTDVSLLRKAMIETRDIQPVSQWSWFLRNHDEIDLGRLTEEQRAFVEKKFGPDPSMQLYNRGIRRRLAPMLKNQRLLELAYSLLFSLPGSPELHYGEELGMGDDLNLQERLAVRTPMPWTKEKNAGFTTSDRPIRPLATGEYGYTHYNVQDEERDTASLLEKIQHLSRLRKECPEIGLGAWSIADSSNLHLLVLRYDYEGRSLLIIHNFSDTGQSFPAPKDIVALQDLFTGVKVIPGELLHVQPYGYRWYRISKKPATYKK